MGLLQGDAGIGLEGVSPSADQNALCLQGCQLCSWISFPVLQGYRGTRGLSENFLPCLVLGFGQVSVLENNVKVAVTSQ